MTAPTDATAIDRWVRRRKRRDARRVTIADGLIGGEWPAYVRYRLRFFGLRFIVGAVLHGLTVTVLVRVFPDNASAVAGVYGAVALLRAGWWGMLEVLREAVRTLVRDGQLHQADRVISSWLRSATAIGGALALVTALGAGGWSVAVGWSPTVAYVAVVVGLVCLELPVRAYHSGLSAIRRIYRPLPLLLGLDLFGLALLAGLWPVLGQWAVPIGLLVSGLCVLGTIVHYTRRLYWFVGITPRLGRRPSAPATSSLLFELDARPLTRCQLLPALASAAMSIDAALVLLLTLAGGSHPTASIVLAVALPSLRAGTDWSNLFYFDLKRLEAVPTAHFRRRVVTGLRTLAVPIGIGAGVVAGVMAALAFDGVGLATLCALMALVVTRSLFSAEQLRAFVDGEYGRVLAVSLAIVGLSVVAVVPATAAAALVVLSVVGLLGTLLLVVGSAGLLPLSLRTKRRRPGLVVPLSEWADSFGSRPEPVRLTVITVASRHHFLDPDSATRSATEDFARRAAQLLGADGAVAVVGASQVAIASTGGRASTAGRRVEPGDLHALGAGLLERIDEIRADNGRSGLDRLRAMVESNGRESAAIERDAPSLVELDRRFDRLVRRGIRGGPDRPTPELPADERQAVLAAAVHHASFGVPRSGGRFEVTSASVAGGVTRFYAIPHRVPKRVRAQWRRLVLQQQLAARPG